MKLDPKAIRYLTSEDFRVLAAVCLLRPSSPRIAESFDAVCLEIAELIGAFFSRSSKEVKTMKLYRLL